MYAGWQFVPGVQRKEWSQVPFEGLELQPLVTLALVGGPDTQTSLHLLRNQRLQQAKHLLQRDARLGAAVSLFCLILLAKPASWVWPHLIPASSWRRECPAMRGVNLFIRDRLMCYLFSFNKACFILSKTHTFPLGS